MRYNNFVLCVLVASLSSASAAIVTTNDASLPGSLSRVISTLEKDQGCSEVSTACLITSRSVTRQQKGELVSAVAGSDESAKALGTSEGLVLVQPDSSVAEITSAASACGGSVLFYPDAVDLARGEGLFGTLAPAMEAILASGKGSTLIVVAPEGVDADTTQRLLEKSAETILSTLVSDSDVAILEDVFTQVLYVSSPTAAAAAVAGNSKTALADATERVTGASALASAATGPAELSSAANLAAARKLGPAARVYLGQAVKQVEQVCWDSSGAPQLVVNFGELCDAAVQQALNALQAAAGEAPGLLSSPTAGHIKASLLSDLDRELHVFFDEQMEQLKLATFEEFKKGLSKLLVSPNLGSDMGTAGQKSIAAFAKSAKKMASKRCSSFNVEPAKDQYRRKIKEHVKNRLLNAQASGQFKPLPRKGVTVGLHWLLPKPFGNDFRQEPWMVHATDNMVYIPKDKITDVSPEEVAAGDWRSKVVPSPVGNDMLYMQ